MTFEVSLHLSVQRMMPLSSVQLFQLSWQARGGLSCCTTFYGKGSNPRAGLLSSINGPHE